MNESEPVAVAVGGGMGLLFLAAVLLVYVFFLLNLQRCLEQVRPENREMEPAMVWLNLVPLFNLVWIFITVIRLAASVCNEARRLELEMGDGGKTLGIVYAVLVIASAIPLLNILTSLPALVAFVMYWVRIAGYRRDLRGARADPAF